MTKLLIVATMILILCSGVVAQEKTQGITAKGLKIGLNIANTRADETEDLVEPVFSINSVKGIVLGGFFTYSFSPTIAIQPEFLYSTKGARLETDISDAYYEVKLNYIEVPILLKYQLANGSYLKPCLYTGPAAAYLVKATRESKDYEIFTGDPIYESEDVTDEVSKKLDIGIVVGGSIGMAVGKNELTLDARYTYGLTNFKEEEEDDDSYNTALSFLVGFSF